jgi:hypothetical protein
MKVNHRFGGTYRLHLHRRVSQTRNQGEVGGSFTLVSCLAYFLTLKTDMQCYSESSVDFQWTTLH